MILYDLSDSEAHPAYQMLAISNGDRQYSFLHSLVTAAVDTKQNFLSQSILKALNYHAIACLHTNAGEYRPCEVQVSHPDPDQIYQAPAHFRVSAMMDNFTNRVNSMFEKIDPILLGSLVLWRLCAIHPFINGNGRTARAACYYVLCLRAGGWLPGTTILPSLLKQDERYVPALKAADASVKSGTLDLSDLCNVVQDCLQRQLDSADSPDDNPQDQ